MAVNVFDDTAIAVIREIARRVLMESRGTHGQQDSQRNYTPRKETAYAKGSIAAGTTAAPGKSTSCTLYSLSTGSTFYSSSEAITVHNSASDAVPSNRIYPISRDFKSGLWNSEYWKAGGAAAASYWVEYGFGYGHPDLSGGGVSLTTDSSGQNATPPTWTFHQSTLIQSYSTVLIGGAGSLQVDSTTGMAFLLAADINIMANSGYADTKWFWYYAEAGSTNTWTLLGGYYGYVTANSDNDMSYAHLRIAIPVTPIKQTWYRLHGSYITGTGDIAFRAHMQCLRA